eukprot:CCRYP_020513-RB/>CCRYP_020513-RB protein AED:0.09 eAED:0.09 QI:328/1/1/1/0.75/0.4/5/1039/363
MRLLVSSAALAAATGHSLLKPALGPGVDTQVHQAAGAECLFVNSFKLGHAADLKSHDDGPLAVDTGILACPASFTCVEDSTSSMGGRCVSLWDRDHHGYLEPYFDVQAHRALTACTFDNGTAGTKCYGVDACTGLLDVRRIECGSCNGVKACYHAARTLRLPEGACNGDGACREMDVGYVPSGSCNGFYACSYSDQMYLAEGVCNEYRACARSYRSTIHEGSCNGKRACYRINLSTIGAGSCVGEAQCSMFRGTIGSNSCTGDKIEGRGGDVGQACAYSFGLIGDDSCYEYHSCYQYPTDPIYPINVGSNSCRGYYACAFPDVVTIENDSCNGERACYRVSSDVGDMSWCDILGIVAVSLFVA